jgi:hypothetical protein
MGFSPAFMPFRDESLPLMSSWPWIQITILSTKGSLTQDMQMGTSYNAQLSEPSHGEVCVSGQLGHIDWISFR